MLPPSPSGVSSGMEWCHLGLCVYLALTQRPNTTSITPLYYPSLDSVALFPSQKLPHQQPSKYTLHPSLSTYNNEGEILLLEEERGGFLIFAVPSLAINAVRALLIGVWEWLEERRGVCFCVFVCGLVFCAYLCCMLLSTPSNNVYVLYYAAWILKATF